MGFVFALRSDRREGDTMNPNTEEARRLAESLIDARPQHSEAAQALRTLADEVEWLEAENEALRAFYGEEPMRPAKEKP